MAPRPHDPVCGFCAAFRNYREEGHIRNGLSVDMLTPRTSINQPATLRFFVNQKPSNWPENNLDIEHEKYMHVIGVGEDLRNFFHIHPVKVGPGMWVVTNTFTRSGNYRIWTDVSWQGVSYSFGHPLLHVSGGKKPALETPDFHHSAIVSGYKVTLEYPEPLIAGTTNHLQFTLQDAAGKNVELQNFLGAPMHLVMVKADLSVYLHGHPDIPAKGDGVVQFSPILASEGVYKLFAQFRPSNAVPAPDTALLAQFYVKVERRSLVKLATLPGIEPGLPP